MKVISAGPAERLAMLVHQFVRNFPALEKPDVAIGRCKFYSMELAKFLISNGISATVYHVQHIRNPEAWPNAHKDWKETNAKKWSHYVVRAGNAIIDVTSRQLDPDGQHPRIMPFKELTKSWKIVERDNFITKVTKELT